MPKVCENCGKISLISIPSHDFGMVKDHAWPDHANIPYFPFSPEKQGSEMPLELISQSD